jgi:hypothetical protein
VCVSTLASTLLYRQVTCMRVRIVSGAHLKAFFLPPLPHFLLLIAAQLVHLSLVPLFASHQLGAPF